jgi:hypothetical protein
MPASSRRRSLELTSFRLKAEVMVELERSLGLPELPPRPSRSELTRASTQPVAAKTDLKTEGLAKLRKLVQPGASEADQVAVEQWLYATLKDAGNPATMRGICRDLRSGQLTLKTVEDGFKASLAPGVAAPAKLFSSAIRAVRCGENPSPRRLSNITATG